jgi:prepilin-type N-terminal cleavage/methylation domain-containing protein/prepilin-type processing-associated H-X9-DG protein
MKQFARSRFGHGPAAFTLIELLAVIVIIAMLAALLVPVMSRIRAKGDDAACASNLRQIGIGIGSYAADNDGTLPGPLTKMQMPTYTAATTGSLAVSLIKYLGLPPATGTPAKVPIFLCPAYVKAVPTLNTPVYAVDPISNAAAPNTPFGDPDNPTAGQPMRLAALSNLADSSTGNPVSLANSSAVRDYLDLSATLTQTGATTGGGTTGAGGQTGSIKPVHTDHVNVLFYDWHVAPRVSASASSTGH